MALPALCHEAAQSTAEHARALRAAAASDYTVWEASDVCSDRVETKDCSVDVSCSACLTRTGCAIESTTGRCVSTARINTTAITVGIAVEYLLAGEVQYCDASDDACSACGEDGTASDAVCRGSGDCVCVRQCELASARASKCDSSSGQSFSLYYAIIAVALIAPVLIMKRMYKGLTSGFPNAAEQRERRQAARDANPLTMKLDGWRGFIERERQDSAEKSDIKLCPTLSIEGGVLVAAHNGLQRSNHTTAPTEDDENETKHVGEDYMPVTTPTGSTSTQIV